MYTSGDVEKVLHKLNIEFSQRGRELQGKCPGHKKAVGREDNNPSWSINEETGAHHCFSCGYKGSLITLVADLLGLDNLDDAKTWLEANVEVDLKEVIKQTAALKDRYYAMAQPIPMSEARLAVFTDPPSWALDARYLTLESCWSHTVRWAEGLNSWILPIRDAATASLLGWQEKGQGSRYFKNRPAGVKRATTLFGIEKFHDLSITDMVLVESPLDAVRLFSLGVQGGVASYGASVSVDQVKLLRRADRVTIAMDNDAAGYKASKQISEMCRKLGIEFQYFNYGESDVKDIGDMTDSDILNGLENAKHMALGNIFGGI